MAGGALPVGALAGLTATLVLTHNISALLGLGLLGLWLLAQPLLAGSPGAGGAPRRGGGGGAGGALGGVALGLGLAAFFWLPALAEGPFVQLNLAQGGLYDPANWLFDPFSAGGRLARADYVHTRLGPADLSLIFDYNAVGGFSRRRSAWGRLLLWLTTVGVGGGLWAYRLWSGRPAVR